MRLHGGKGEAVQEPLPLGIPVLELRHRRHAAILAGRAGRAGKESFHARRCRFRALVPRESRVMWSRSWAGKTGSGSVSSRSPERTSRAERGTRSLHSFRWSSRAAGRSRDTASSSSRRRLRARPRMLSGSPNIACPATSCSTARRTSRMVFRGYPVSVHTTSSSIRMACLRALLAWLPDASLPSGSRMPPCRLRKLRRAWRRPILTTIRPVPCQSTSCRDGGSRRDGTRAGARPAPKATSVFQTIRGGRPPRHR